MKKSLFSLAFILLFAGWVSAQQQNTAQQQQQTQAEEQQQSGGPVMTFDETTIDYGVIEQGSDPYRYFNFTNTGDAPLIISNARGSCGCTVPTWPKEPILPGESAQIKVRYDTKRIGKFTKTVTLTTNEAEGTHRLIIKGEVKPKQEEPAAIPESKGGF